MATRIADIDGHRCLTVDAHSARNPESVFIMGPRGMCFEVDKLTFIRAMKRELELVEPVTAGAERFLQAAS